MKIFIKHKLNQNTDWLSNLHKEKIEINKFDLMNEQIYLTYNFSNFLNLLAIS